MCCFNGLCLNPRKTKALIIGKVHYKAQLSPLHTYIIGHYYPSVRIIDLVSFSPLQIDNTTIEIVDNAKNLEVIFNNSLNQSNLINAICRQNGIFVLNTLKSQKKKINFEESVSQGLSSCDQRFIIHMLLIVSQVSSLKIEEKGHNMNDSFSSGIRALNEWGRKNKIDFNA